MNRNISAKNKPSYKVYGFWSIIVLLTLVFVGFVVWQFIRSTSRLTIAEDMTNMKYEYILDQKGTYYVLVYSYKDINGENNELYTEELKETIEIYLNHAKENKEAPKLYGMNLDDIANRGSLKTGTSSTSNTGVTSYKNVKINEKDVPTIIKVTDGKVVKDYVLEIDILEELKVNKD